ncbi:MAG: hypothetical protein EOO46_15220 [Flavobacterium sp.]|nr:MAG: hypothetical protein EOO46_15220 [Flavobacterium sp.]
MSSCNSAKNSELMLGNWECTNGQSRPPIQLYVTKSYFIYKSIYPSGVQLDTFNYKLVNGRQILTTDPSGMSHEYIIESLDKKNFHYADLSGYVVTFERQ